MEILFKRIANYVVFYNKLSLPGENKKDLSRFMVSKISTFIIYILCVQVYLPGFAVFLNLSDLAVSLITTIPACMLLTQLISPLIYERYNKRGRIIARFQVLFCLFLNAVVLIPLFISGWKAEYVLIGMIFTAMFFYAQFKTGVDVWLMETVETRIRGTYLARQRMVANLILIVLVLLLGKILDFFEKGYTGFLIIYTVSIVFSLTLYFKLRSITDIEFNIDRTRKLSFRDLFLIPVRNRNFMKICIMGFMAYFSTWICYSFRSLYLIRYIDVSYTFYSVLSNISILTEVLFASVWARLALKKNWNVIFFYTIIFFSAEFLTWIFVTDKTTVLTLFAYFCAGAANSGLILSMLNIRYDCMPRENRSVYEGFYCTMSGAACLIGPIAGNLLREVMPVIRNSLFYQSEIQLVFLVSFIINCVFILYLVRNKRKSCCSDSSVNK